MSRILIGNIKGPQGAQGIQGPQGPVGATGPQGPMPDLINNALATQAGVAALDAVMGKTLQDQITELNSDKIGTSAIENQAIKFIRFPASGLGVEFYNAIENSWLHINKTRVIPDGWSFTVEALTNRLVLKCSNDEEGYRLDITSTDIKFDKITGTTVTNIWIK